jgi:hypothetical protein
MFTGEQVTCTVEDALDQIFATLQELDGEAIITEE